MCVTVSASVALCLLFGPKMYLVLLHPEKCARTYPGNKKPTNNKTVFLVQPTTEIWRQTSYFFLFSVKVFKEQGE